MNQPSKIFEEHYEDYCRQIKSVDLAAVSSILDIRIENNIAEIPFFDRIYHVSGDGVLEKESSMADYVTSVILSKYLLLCPDKLHLDLEWCTFRDFKKESHFTNTNYFASDTTQRISRHFEGRLADLEAACERINGRKEKMDLAYDLTIVVPVLPRLSLLLLANGAEDNFPADCRVLFQRQGEYYLDPESLAMVGALLAKKLIEADENDKE